VRELDRIMELLEEGIERWAEYGGVVVGRAGVGVEGEISTSEAIPAQNLIKRLFGMIEGENRETFEHNGRSWDKEAGRGTEILARLFIQFGGMIS